MTKFRGLGSGLAMVAAMALTIGCQQDKGSKATPPVKKAKNEDHAHGEGPHGGAVADWGGGKFHVEFTVDHDKKEATVYILGSDEKTAAPIAAKDGQLSLSIKGLKNKDEYKVVLKAEPQEGDPAGKASRFVGKEDKLGVVQEFAGTISGEADGAPYSGDFKEEPGKDKK